MYRAVPAFSSEPFARSITIGLKREYPAPNGALFLTNIAHYDHTFERSELFWLAVCVLSIEDALGNRSLISLTEVKYGKPANALFKFKPPEGADVISALGDQ